jgi:hypothetical protein
VTDIPHYRKDQPIWWHVSVSKIPRPPWITKATEWEAGWVQKTDGTNAVITLMNESRHFETYVVPLDQIRERMIP